MTQDLFSSQSVVLGYDFNSVDGEWRINCKIIDDANELKIHHHTNTTLGDFTIHTDPASQRQYITTKDGLKYTQKKQKTKLDFLFLFH